MLTQAKHIILTVFVLLAVNASAQLEETSQYYYVQQPSELFSIDTGLQDMEAYNFMQRPQWDYFNLGNTGQAHYATNFQWQESKGFKSGMIAFDNYKYTRDKIKYYKIAKPLSEINYFLGSKRENIFGAKFAHNLKNRLNYGVDFHRIQSTGVYQNIRTRNGDFSMYGIFYSKNSRYELSLALTFNKLKTEESGGLVQDFVNDASLKEPNKDFYDPKISEGITQHKNLDVWVTNTYHLGKHKIDSINDTLSIKKFYPSISFSYSTGTQRNTFEFVDNAADSLYYGDFMQQVDSTFYRLYYHQIPNRLSVSYSGLMAKKDSLQYKNFRAEVGVQHDNIELWQNRKEFTTNNLHVDGYIQSNAQSKKPWYYEARAHYYFTGYNQNDWKVAAFFGYDFKKWGKVRVAGGLEQQEATWIEHSYFSESLTWENTFNKKTRTHFEFQYQIPRWRLQLDAGYQVLGSYIYFNEQAQPQQLSEALQYWHVSASKMLQYKIWHFDNFVGVQGSSNDAILRLPQLYLKSSFYVEGKIFKGKMLGRVGADLRYNTSFAANAWQPLVGQFYLQNQQNMQFTPVLDIFLSFKVKTLRVFAKANYINEGLIQNNYYTALGYPDRGRTFAGGFIWRFFE